MTYFVLLFPSSTTFTPDFTCTTTPHKIIIVTCLIQSKEAFDFPHFHPRPTSPPYQSEPHPFRDGRLQNPRPRSYILKPATYIRGKVSKDVQLSTSAPLSNDPRLRWRLHVPSRWLEANMQTRSWHLVICPVQLLVSVSSINGDFWLG